MCDVHSEFKGKKSVLRDVNSDLRENYNSVNSELREKSKNCEMYTQNLL